MEICKDDFIELCGIETPTNWDHFFVTDKGVFVKRFIRNSDEALLRPSIGTQLDRHRHPTGDPLLPALAFPCNLPEVEDFLNSYGLSNCLQPHALLAWSVKKQGECSLDELEKRLTDCGLSDSMKQHTLLEWEKNNQRECREQHREDSALFWKYGCAMDGIGVEQNSLALHLRDWLTKERGRKNLLPKLTLDGIEYTVDAHLYKRLDGIPGAAEKLARLVHGKKSPSPSYHIPIYDRLEPKTDWRGGYMADTDVLTLDDAAKFATKHSGEEVAPSDILRAAGRGQIRLKAIIHRTAKVQKYDGGIYCNKGQENENMAPAGAIASLPQTACEHLAATGRASWRTFDGFELIDGVWCRYTKGQLVDGEPDFETSVADCRVTGREVHALADELCDSTETRDVNVSRKDAAPETDASKGTPPKLSNDQQKEVVQLYARGHGFSVYRLAVLFRVSRPTIDKVLKKARVKI